MARQRAAVLALILLLLSANGLFAKRRSKRGKGKPLSTEELAWQQNEVLVASAELAKEGNFVEAAQKLRDLTERVTNMDKSGGLGANLFNTMGEYYKVGKELEDAEESFEAAINCIYGFREFSDGLGDDEQMINARRHVEANELHRARSNLAKLREVEGDSDGVVEQYKTLLREVDIPEYKALAAKELGVYHQRMDDLPMAKAFLTFAVEIHPGVAKGYSNLALVLHKLDELDEAEEAFLEAIKLEPDNANVYANLGTLYAQSGEVHDAEKYFKMALERDPRHRDAAEKLRTLEEMKEADGMGGGPKFRSPMKRVGGNKKPKPKMEL